MEDAWNTHLLENLVGIICNKIGCKFLFLQLGRCLCRLLLCSFWDSVEDSPSAQANKVQRQVTEQPMVWDIFTKYNCEQMNQARSWFKSWFIVWLHCPVWNENDITVALIEHTILLLQLWFSQGPPSATLWTFMGEWFSQIEIYVSTIEMSRKELNVLLDLLQHSRIHSRAFECDSPAGCEALAGVSQCFLEPAFSKAVQVYKPQSFQLLTRFFCRKTSSVQPIRCLSWDLSWTGSLSPAFSSGWD